MTRTQSHAAIMFPLLIASTRAGGPDPVGESALFSLTTLAAVIGAFLIALLIVAAVRRADR